MHTIVADTRVNQVIEQPLAACERLVRVRRGRLELRMLPVLVGEMLEADGFRFDEWDRSGASEVIKHGRHRTVTRVTLRSGTYYIKHNRTPGIGDVVRNTLRGSRAAREFESIRLTREAGIPTVDPVAVGHIQAGPFVRDSYLVTRAIADTVTLEELFVVSADTLTATDRRHLAVQLGRLIGRLHANNLLHRDLHAGNFLVRREAFGEFNLWLIDVQNLREYKSLTQSRIAHELAMFSHFFRTHATSSERTRFLRAYLAANPIGEERSLIAQITTAAERWSRTVTTKADRKWQRGHRKLIIVENDDVHCRGVAELGEAVINEFAKGRADVLPTQADDSSSVIHEYDADVKRVRWLGTEQPWSAARRVWEFGHALHRRGVPTNRPLVMIEHRTNREQRDAVVFESETRNVAPKTATFEQIRQAGRLIRQLHDAGFVFDEGVLPIGVGVQASACPVVHGNAIERTTGNLKVELQPVMTRIEHLTPVTCVRPKDAVQQLSSLDFANVSPKNRLRFLLEYLGPKRRHEWKTLWRAVENKASSSKPRRRFLKAALVLAGAMIGCTAPEKQTLLRPAEYSVRSGPLLVKSDRKLQDDHPAIRDLVRLRKQIAVSLKLPAAREEVVVYIFNTEKEYRDYLNSAYPGLPSRRAYFVGTQQELAVYTYWGSRIQEDLRHEYTHGILHASLRTVPLWLDEGLAEYFEVGGARPGNPNSDYAIRLTGELQKGWKPSIEQLEAIEEFKQMQHNHYRESWAWVHFLLHHSPETKQVLLSYLSDLRTKKNPKPISQRLRQDLPQYAQRFKMHISTLQHPRLLSDEKLERPKIQQAKYETPAPQGNSPFPKDDAPFPSPKTAKPLPKKTPPSSPKPTMPKSNGNAAAPFPAM